MPSSVIKQMEYDKRKKVLRITFVSGKIYDYASVPEKIFVEMKSAKSKGIFFNQQIKPGFAFTEIEKEEMNLPVKKTII